MSKEKIYLGDAVYAKVDDWGNLVLTTEDGIRATNRIVLELQVLQALFEYLGVEDMRKAREDSE